MSLSQHAETMTDAELEDWGPLALPLAEPLGDPMPTRGLETWSSADEKTSFSAFDMGLGLGAEFAPLHRVSVGAMLKLGLWNVGRDTGANSIKTGRFVVYTRIPIGKTR